MVIAYYNADSPRKACTIGEGSGSYGIEAF